MGIIFACIVLLFAPTNRSNAHDSINRAFDGIVRVETNDSRGSGFIVASEAKRFEVWTNGHVTGKVGSYVTIKTNAGTSTEEVFKGKVVWRRYGNGWDAAKVICRGGFAGAVLRVCDDDCRGELFATSGHPLGGRGYCISLTPKTGRSFGIVTAYLPASIPGQSGSPVVSVKGEVIGVVTYRSGIGRDAVGGMLPISQWTETGFRGEVKYGTGSFAELPNAKPPG